MQVTEFNVWKGLYVSTQKIAWAFVGASILCFLASAAVANQLSDVGLISQVLANFDIIGCIASAIAAIACDMVFEARKLENTSQMTTIKKNLHNAALAKVRQAKLVFFLMFGIFLTLVSFRGQEMRNFAVLCCQAGGVFFLGLALLANKMANQIKLKYLNQ